MSREAMLQSIREALGRQPEQAIPAPPPVRIRVPEGGSEGRVAQFRRALEALNAKTYEAGSAAAVRAQVETVLDGRRAVASNSRVLAELGVAEMAGVLSGVTDLDVLRAECEVRDFGITSADYALADTGTLVMIASPEEARLVSLLPPIHLAVVPRERILSGLDELFTLLPKPALQSSSVVLITGPSRTADIEQILVRGVHGPGEVHVIVM